MTIMRLNPVLPTEGMRVHDEGRFVFYSDHEKTIEDIESIRRDQQGYISQLRTERANLKLENSKLKKRIAELERKVDTRAQGSVADW